MVAGLSSLKARIRRNPEDGESWLALALQLAQSPPGPDLRQAISESIRLLPDNYQAWLLAGLELQQRQGARGARHWLQHVARQKPELAAPRLAHAQLLAAGRDDAASEAFLAVIRDFPGDSRACLLYAEYLQNQSQLGAAGDYLEKALELQPGIIENWTALAKIRLAEQRFEEVIAAATQALAIDVNALEARMTRAEAYRQAAQWQLAKADYQVLLQAMPRNPYVLMGLGASLAGERDFSQAMRALTESVKYKPDLAEARLNIALVNACQGNRKQALQEFQRLLASGTLAPGLRESAEICAATLEQHQKLQPCLEETVRLNSPEPLEDVLRRSPAVLLRTDSRMAMRLEELAKAARETQWPESDSAEQQVNSDGADLPLYGFIEACLTSRTSEQAAGIARLWEELQAEPAGARRALPAPLEDAWQAIRDRQARLLSLSGTNGEAWLRYWHYRLFQQSAADFPGQFKFAPNSIGLHRTTAPQHLVKAVRCALDEIRPTIEPGFGRACFTLVAIAWIHPFVDGNGRMSRFAFAAELESAGLPPVLLLTQARKDLTACQDQAQYRNDFAAFSRFLRLAHGSTLDLVQAVKRELQAA
jgi:tetratricopeptide (TPR) repeat protein/fido (protein-threonine AMPylation protein)